jgi:hypothetical protein
MFNTKIFTYLILSLGLLSIFALTYRHIGNDPLHYFLGKDSIYILRFLTLPLGLIFFCIFIYLATKKIQSTTVIDGLSINNDCLKIIKDNNITIDKIKYVINNNEPEKRLNYYKFKFTLDSGHVIVVITDKTYGVIDVVI